MGGTHDGCIEILHGKRRGRDARLDDWEILKEMGSTASIGNDTCSASSASSSTRIGGGVRT
jgi:hypothetical protein